MDSQILRWNERFKAASGVMTNLGSALLAAAFARWFVVGFDPFVLAWLVASIMLIGSGIHVLKMLEAGDAAG
jgi:chaperone required for assembly of F1-ATPase